MVLLVLGFVFAVLVGLGTGGGLLLIPLLVLLMDYPLDLAQQITLLLYLPLSAVITVINIKRQSFNTKAKPFAGYLLLGVAGVVAGVFLMRRIDTDILRYMYAVFILAAGVWQLIGVIRPARK